MSEETKEEFASTEATMDKKIEESAEAAKEAVEAVEEATEKVEIAEEKIEEAKEEIKEAAKEEVVEKPAPSGKFKDLIKQIEDLSVLELSELVKELENRFGVSAATPVAVAAAGGAASAEVAEEKTSFDVVLASAGDKKIQVIKAVREIKPDLGLVEAKTLVESAPKDLLKGVKKDEADAAKAKLEEAGATVELR